MGNVRKMGENRIIEQQRSDKNYRTTKKNRRKIRYIFFIPSEENRIIEQQGTVNNRTFVLLNFRSIIPALTIYIYIYIYIVPKNDTSSFLNPNGFSKGLIFLPSAFGGLVIAFIAGTFGDGSVVGGSRCTCDATSCNSKISKMWHYFWMFTLNI